MNSPIQNRPTSSTKGPVKGKQAHQSSQIGIHERESRNVGSVDQKGPVGYKEATPQQKKGFFTKVKEFFSKLLGFGKKDIQSETKNQSASELPPHIQIKTVSPSDVQAAPPAPPVAGLSAPLQVNSGSITAHFRADHSKIHPEPQPSRESVSTSRSGKVKQSKVVPLQSSTVSERLEAFKSKKNGMMARSEILDFVNTNAYDLRRADNDTLNSLAEMITSSLVTDREAGGSIEGKVDQLDRNINFLSQIKKQLPKSAIGLGAAIKSMTKLKDSIESITQPLSTFAAHGPALTAENPSNYNKTLESAYAQLKTALSNLDEAASSLGSDFPADQLESMIRESAATLVNDQLESSSTQLSDKDYDKSSGQPSVSQRASRNASKSRMLVNFLDSKRMTRLMPQQELAHMKNQALENFRANAFQMTRADIQAEVSVSKSGKFEKPNTEMNSTIGTLTQLSDYRGFDVVSSAQKEVLSNLFDMAELGSQDMRAGKELLMSGLNSMYDSELQQAGDTAMPDKVNQTINGITHLQHVDDSFSGGLRSTSGFLDTVMTHGLPESEKISALRVGNPVVDKVRLALSKGVEDLGLSSKGLASAQHELDQVSRQLVQLFNVKVPPNRRINASNLQFDKRTVQTLHNTIRSDINIRGKGLEGILLRAALVQNTIQQMQADSDPQPGKPFSPRNNINQIYDTLVGDRLSGTRGISEKQSMADQAEIDDLTALKTKLNGLQHCTNISEFRDTIRTLNSAKDTFVSNNKGSLINIIARQSDHRDFTLQALKLKFENKANRSYAGSAAKVEKKVMRNVMGTIYSSEAVGNTLKSNQQTVDIKHQLDKLKLKNSPFEQTLSQTVSQKFEELMNEHDDLSVSDVRDFVAAELSVETQKPSGEQNTLLQTFTDQTSSSKKRDLFNATIRHFVDKFVQQHQLQQGDDLSDTASTISTSSMSSTSTVSLDSSSDFEIQTDFRDNPSFEKIVEYFERKDMGTGALERMQIKILDQVVRERADKDVVNLSEDDARMAENDIVRDVVSEMMRPDNYALFSRDKSKKGEVKKAIYRDMVTHMTRQAVAGDTVKWTMRLNLNEAGLQKASKMGQKSYSERVSGVKDQLRHLDAGEGTTNNFSQSYSSGDLMLAAGAAQRMLFNFSFTIDGAHTQTAELGIHKGEDGSVFVRFSDQNKTTTTTELASMGNYVSVSNETSASVVDGKVFKFDDLESAANAIVRFNEGDVTGMTSLSDGIIFEDSFSKDSSLLATLNIKDPFTKTGLQLDGDAGLGMTRSSVRDGFNQTHSTERTLTFGGTASFSEGVAGTTVGLTGGRFTSKVRTETTTPIYNSDLITNHQIVTELSISSFSKDSPIDQLRSKVESVIGKSQSFEALDDVIDTTHLESFAESLGPGDTFEVVHTLNEDALKSLTPENTTTVLQDMSNYSISLRKVTVDTLGQRSSSVGSSYSSTHAYSKQKTEVLSLNMPKIEDSPQVEVQSYSQGPSTML